jgi:hypothetical protein
VQRTIKLNSPIKPFSKIWDKVCDLNWHRSNFHPKTLRLRVLRNTQPSVTLKGLLTCDETLRIYVVKIEGKYYIRDGHHRVTKARILGRKAIDALVAEV